MSRAAIERALASTARREARLDRRAGASEPAWRTAAAARIPEKAEAALRAAFARAFALLFERPALLEYGVRPDELAALFSVRDAAFDARPGRASLRRLGSGARRANSLKAAASAVEGVALGALGIGLPDIVLFLALLMRGVRATARSWGFGCDTAAERLYMLRLMRCALSRGGERAEREHVDKAAQRERGAAARRLLFRLLLFGLLGLCHILCLLKTKLTYL